MSHLCFRELQVVVKRLHHLPSLQPDASAISLATISLGKHLASKHCQKALQTQAGDKAEHACFLAWKEALAGVMCGVDAPEAPPMDLPGVRRAASGPLLVLSTSTSTLHPPKGITASS